MYTNPAYLAIPFDPAPRPPPPAPPPPPPAPPPNQAYSRLSTTHGHIIGCKLDSVVYAWELMWTCLAWAERSTPDSFWVPGHQFNPATGEQK